MQRGDTGLLSDTVELATSLPGVTPRHLLDSPGPPALNVLLPRAPPPWEAMGHHTPTNRRGGCCRRIALLNVTPQSASQGVIVRLTGQGVCLRLYGPSI